MKFQFVKDRDNDDFSKLIYFWLAICVTEDIFPIFIFMTVSGRKADIKQQTKCSCYQAPGCLTSRTYLCLCACKHCKDTGLINTLA